MNFFHFRKHYMIWNFLHILLQYPSSFFHWPAKNTNTQQMSTTTKHQSITIYYPKLIIFLKRLRVWCYNLDSPPLLTHFWESWDKTMGTQSENYMFSPQSDLCGGIYIYLYGHRLKYSSPNKEEPFKMWRNIMPHNWFETPLRCMSDLSIVTLLMTLSPRPTIH
jgi:hypothetical protein